MATASLRAGGRPDEILLEIEELELGRLSDQLGRLLRIRDACQLDHDLVRALLSELRLGDAELVDAIPHDVDGAIEVFSGERVSLRRMSLEHDLETALEVEPERCARWNGEPGTAIKATPMSAATIRPTRVR